MLRRRRSQAGAVAGVLALAMVLVVVGALLTVDLIAVGSSRERATSAADAAAHAAMTVLDVQANRDDLSVEVQAGRTFCEYNRSAGTDHTAESACAEAFTAARSIAETDGATLTYYVIGADLHQLSGRAHPVGFQVVVRVARRAALPFGGVPCAQEPPAQPDFCWTLAASAAEVAA